MNLPTPHHDKLSALLENTKLPSGDISRVNSAIARYEEWQKDLDSILSENENTPENILEKLVNSLNSYKLYIDLEFIFDSQDDFLYRQKGQLKLDNTIIEEFLPRIVHHTVIPEVSSLDLTIGPTNTFSAAYFTSSLDNQKRGGGIGIRTKDQDFAIARKLYIKASHNEDFSDSVERNTHIAYIVAECKTNLDKTMFQEACATAGDVRRAVSRAKYFLLCEWLDMTPLSTIPTDVEEVILLRKAKRISSNRRKLFSSYQGRQAKREEFKKYLEDNPFRFEVFDRFRLHIKKLLSDEAPIEKNVLEMGYF